MAECVHALNGTMDPDHCRNCALLAHMARRERAHDPRWHEYHCTLVDMMNDPEVTGEQQRKARPKVTGKLGRRRKARLVR